LCRKANIGLGHATGGYWPKPDFRLLHRLFVARAVLPICDYIVFFFAIRVKKFQYNMQFIMLSRSSLALFTDRSHQFPKNYEKTFYKLKVDIIKI
jgi:hypothetical protein